MQNEQFSMELKIDQEKNIAYIKIIGPVSSKDILEAFDVAVSDEKYKKGMGRLWDFTEIDLSSIESSVIPSMARHSLLFPPGICDVKVAFVVTKTMEYGLTRMFQMHSDLDAKTKVIIFNTIDEAERWMTKKEDS
jgi:hypothetical protein